MDVLHIFASLMLSAACEQNIKNYKFLTKSDPVNLIHGITWYLFILLREEKRAKIKYNW